MDHGPDIESVLSKAIARARDVQGQWSRLPVESRLRPLKALRERLVRDTEHFVRVVRDENGKTELEALSQEILPVLDTAVFLEKNVARLLRKRRMSGATRQFYFRGKQNEVVVEPYGVIGILGTWNYPFVISMTQILFALTAGNAVIFKGALESPRVTELTRELLVSSGFPRDLVFAFSSGADGGRALCRAGCDKYLLTGSRATGRAVMKLLADGLKPSVMELSGSDPYVILPDADWGLAVNTLVWASFQYSGQTCVAPRRVFVLKEDEEKFLAALRAEWKRNAVYLDEKGMLRSADRAADEKRKLMLLQEKGAKLLMGGEIQDPSSAYFPPQVYGGVAPADIEGLDFMSPVFFVFPCEDERSLLGELARTPFGLGASVWTRDRSKARLFAERIDAGQVWVNDSIFSVALGEAPFGGRRESGFGSTRGAEGFMEMVRPKYLSFDWLKKRPLVHLPPYGPLSYPILSEIQRILYETSFRNRLRAVGRLVKTALKGNGAGK